MNNKLKAIAKNTAIKSKIMFQQHGQEILIGVSSLAIIALMKKQHKKELERVKTRELGKGFSIGFDSGYISAGVCIPSATLNELIDNELVTKEDVQPYYDDIMTYLKSEYDEEDIDAKVKQLHDSYAKDGLTAHI